MGSKMSRLQRAKQFMPFAALKGFEELLAKVASHREAKVELSEDQMDELNKMIQGMESGDWVRIVYYTGKQYAEVVGPIDAVLVPTETVSIKGLIIPFTQIKEINYYDNSL